MISYIASGFIVLVLALALVNHCIGEIRRDMDKQE